MSIYKRGDIWWMDVYMGNSRRRVRKSTGCTDEVQARIVEQTAMAVNRGITSRQRAMAIIDAVMPQEDRGVPIGDILRWYVTTAKAEGIVLSPKEEASRQSIIARMATWMERNTRARVASDIDDESAWRYATEFQKARQCTVKTRNNEVGHLRTAWELLIKHGKATTNPWTRARGIRRREEETSGRAFTPDEVTRILTASRELGCEWEGVVTVALYTGLRKRDVEGLRWDEVDLTRKVIRKAPSKTARHGIVVSIPMHERVVAVLESAEKGGEWVFPWRQAHPGTGRAKPGDHHFCEVLAKAGIVEQEGELISFHSLRHTFVTRLAEAGVTQDIRMRLAGHTNAATSNHYTHDDVSARTAIEALK